MQTAAQAGFWRSSFLLGIMARDGSPPDQAEAYRWLLIAQRQGGTEAEDLLNNDVTKCRAALDPSLQAEEERQVDAWLQQHPTKVNFVAGNRSRKQSFPVDGIESRLPLALN